MQTGEFFFIVICITSSRALWYSEFKFCIPVSIDARTIVFQKEMKQCRFYDRDYEPSQVI